MRTAEEILNEKETAIVFVSPEVTVHDALAVMVEKKIGAILVKEHDEFVGIYTERDLLQDSVYADFNPWEAKLRNHMATNLLTAPQDAPLYQLQDTILGKRIRHILIVKEGKTIGVLSAGDIMKAHMNDISQQLKSVGWDYYENWRWKKK